MPATVVESIVTSPDRSSWCSQAWRSAGCPNGSSAGIDPRQTVPNGLSCNPLLRSSAALRVAARLIGLYRGTGNRPVRTEHAAVPRLGPQQRSAACTVVEVDARIRRHALTRDMSTVRTGQFGGRDQRRL